MFLTSRDSRIAQPEVTAVGAALNVFNELAGVIYARDEATLRAAEQTRS